MSGDAVSMVAEMTPYVTGALGAYGAAVLVRARDEAADATIGLGRRLLQRIFGVQKEGEQLPEPLREVAADPQDHDALSVLRLRIRKELAADSQLAADVRTMLTSVGIAVTASGERAIAAQVINAPAATGDNATIGP